MGQKQQQSLRLSVIVLASIGGCAPAAVDPRWPEPRPLGKDIPTFQAPEHPTPRDEARREYREPSDTLTLREALSLALMKNPGLAVFSWEVRAQEADALQAGLLPNPELTLETENFAGSGELGGFDASETTISLSQLVQLAGKREKQFRVAALERDLAGWDYEARRIDLLTDVTIAFVNVLALQERVVVANELVRVTDRELDEVSRRVTAGAESPVEEIRARVALAMSRVERDRMVRRLTAARKHLAALWGSSTADFSLAVGEFEEAEPPPALEDLLQGTDKSPGLARWTTELEHRQAVLGLERAHRIPDLGVEGGFRHAEESSDNAFVVGVSVALPLFDRNQRAIQAANYRLLEAEEERLAAEVGARTALAELHEDLSSAFEELVALRDAILPEAAAAFTMAQDAYRKGLFSLTDILDTQRSYFGLRDRYYSALVDYHTSVAEIKRLVAGPLGRSD